MLKRLLLFVSVVIIINFLLNEHLLALIGQELARLVDQAYRGYKDAKSRLTMTLIDSAGNRSVREMMFLTLEKPSHSTEEGKRSIIVFLSPPDIKGTALLTYERLNRSDDQWLYIPALRRVKRILSKNKSGSFMGSEFSYEDIASQSIEKFTYSKTVEKVKYNDRECYKFERYPREKYSGYKKQVLWVDPSSYVILRIDYYDRKGDLLKTAVFSEYKLFKVKGKDVWRTERIHMKNHQNRKETILEWDTDELNIGLNKRYFKKRYLENIVDVSYYF